MPFGTPLGTLSYGTFVWPVNTRTTGYAYRPIYDQAGRTVIYNVITVGLACKISLGDSVTISGSTVDIPNAAAVESVMGLIRAELTKPALPFIYTNCGMGALSVNVQGGAAKDVVWGPRPQLLSLSHLAAANAISLEWTVDVAIPTCSDAIFENQPLEFNYTVTYDIDRSGYTQRLIAGFVRVPMTRRTPSTRTLTTSADEWRARITPELLTGFRRVYGPFTLSSDRTRLDFSIRDEEVGPDYLPEGCVEGKLSHTVRNASQQQGFVRWLGSFEGDFEMSRDYPPEAAWDNFFALIKKRIDFSKAQFVGFDPNDRQNQVTNRVFILPLQLAIGEPDVFGKKTSRFSFVYSMQSSFAQILRNSAMWQPLDTTWDRWSASLAGTAFNSRGSARLKYNPADDAIIDLCLAQGVSVLKNQPRSETPTQRLLRQLTSTCPAPIDSWIHYSNILRVESAQQAFMHTPLPVNRLVYSPITTGFFDPQAVGYQTGLYRDQPENKPQVRSGESLYVWMTGEAIRVCYGISPPELRRIGDIEVVPANRSDRGEGFETWIHADVGHTVVAARWNLRYLLPKPPQSALVATSSPLLPGGASLSAQGQLLLRALQR